MIGFGYDSHKLGKGKDLILGGIKIPSELGTESHSDGDAVLHALCDAIFGASALGDIGEHFPDTDPKYKNADSSIFLKAAMDILKQQNLLLINIDVTIILERPKLSPFKEEIRQNISSLCNLPLERVSIKAKTNEKMGFVGRSEGVCVYCVVQIEKRL